MAALLAEAAGGDGDEDAERRETKIGEIGTEQRCRNCQDKHGQRDERETQLGRDDERALPGEEVEKCDRAGGNGEVYGDVDGDERRQQREQLRGQHVVEARRRSFDRAAGEKQYERYQERGGRDGEAAADLMRAWSRLPQAGATRAGASKRAAGHPGAAARGVDGRATR